MKDFDGRRRFWAACSLSLTAAVELLIRRFGGRFAAATTPRIRFELTGAIWLDDRYLPAGLGGLSGGERRILTVVVVAALAEATGARRIDLLEGREARQPSRP